jgi:hypothetical protein
VAEILAEDSAHSFKVRNSAPSPGVRRIDMLASPLAFVITLGLTLLSLVLAGGPRTPSRTAPRVSGVVVHEWGTFTAVSDRDGKTLVWRPLTVESDLPPFVHSVDKGNTWRRLRYPSKSNLFVRVRMETPVLYFYSGKATTLNVKVGFPDGVITEWYPRALSAGRKGINWGEIRVRPNARVNLPHDRSENHYYPARETDASVVEVSRGQHVEHEKFLFYRGVGYFDLPLSVRLEGNRVTIKNSHPENIGQVILFENTDGKIGYHVLDLENGTAEVERPVLNDQLDELRQDLRTMLLAKGLYEKEVDAMLNTWRDAWFEEGLRVFYVMPRKTTNAMLPITIEPKPVALVRVLVGRTEVITPEIEQAVTKQILDLRDLPVAEKSRALKEMNKYGRFLEAILREILQHTTDPHLNKEVEMLLRALGSGKSNDDRQGPFSTQLYPQRLSH